MLRTRSRGIADWPRAKDDRADAQAGGRGRNVKPLHFQLVVFRAVHRDAPLLSWNVQRRQYNISTGQMSTIQKRFGKISLAESQ